MSLAVITQEIDRFVRTSEPEVMCLRGGWGVGKTYLWNKCLTSCEAKKEVGLEAYSYVSLFGLNSLADLRLSVFQASRSIDNKNKEKNLLDLEGYVNKALGWRKKVPLIKLVPGLGNISEEDAISILSSMLATKQIVCFDDIERRGNDLNVRDVLGYASYLKEERGNKVIIILNDHELDVDGKQQMQEYLEKVVDVSLTLDTTSREAVSVALAKDDGLSKKIAERCSTLGVSNIRVIRRAEKLCRSMISLLKDYQEETVDNVLSSLLLFSWSRDQPKEAPPLEFLKSLASEWRLFALSDDEFEGEKDVEAAKWKPLLEEYGYTSTDELDLAIIDGISVGYFDEEKLRPLIDEFNAGVKAKKADDSFSEAWKLFHETFADNEDVFVEALYTSFKKNFQHITPLNVLGTFRALKDLGQEERAKELVDLYVMERKEGWEFFDLEQNHFIEGEIDPYFREAFDKKRDELSVTLDFKSALLSIGESWNSDMVSFLAEAPIQQYYDTFKAHEGEELRRLLACATRFQRIGNPSPEMMKMKGKVHAALEMIGKESRINARRVRKFGIKIALEEL